MKIGKFTLKNISNKIAYFIAVISSIITIVVYFDKQNVDLRFEILQNISALDIRENLKDLDIYFQGKNLISTNENIQIYSIKVINTGNRTIQETNYAQTSDFGLKINDGVLVNDPKLISASNEYIQSNMNIRLKDKKEIILSKLILEPGEYYIIKFFVLSKNNKTPDLLSNGKIAGMKKRAEIVTTKPEVESSIFRNVFKGNIYVQIVRTILYFFIGLTILGVIILISEYFENKRKILRRKKTVEKFKELRGFKKSDELIFKKYINTRILQTTLLLSLLEDESRLNEIHDEKKGIGLKDSKKGLDNILYETLMDMGIIVIENGKVLVIQERKDTFENFCEYLKNS